MNKAFCTSQFDVFMYYQFYDIIKFQMTFVICHMKSICYRRTKKIYISVFSNFDIQHLNLNASSSLSLHNF